MKEIIEEIHEVWPSSKIIHGRARHKQSQGGVERLNRTVEDKLGSWMTDNKSTKWTVGRLFVRWQINTQFSSSVGECPYKLVLGAAPRLGLSCLPLDRKLLDSLHSEAQVLLTPCPPPFLLQLLDLCALHACAVECSFWSSV